LIQSMTRWKTE